MWHDERPAPRIVAVEPKKTKKQNIVYFQDPYANPDGTPVHFSTIEETSPRTLKSPLLARYENPVDGEARAPVPTLQEYIAYFLYRLAVVRYQKFLAKYATHLDVDYDVKLNTAKGMRLWRECLYGEDNTPLVYARIPQSELPYVDLDDTRFFSTIKVSPDKEGFMITGVDLRIVPSRFGYSVRRYYLLQADLAANRKKKNPMSEAQLIADAKRREVLERERLNPQRAPLSPYDSRRYR